jgi:flagellar hook-associated protein 2
MCAAIQLSGLASGFDWKSFVDQMMAAAHVPADRLSTEKTKNSQKVTALSEFDTRLTTLNTAVAALGTSGIFGQRTATSGTVESSWSASAASGTTVGSYKFTVSQLATAARRDGTANIGSPLAATADVSGLTLANLPTGTAVTAGTFSVNGAKVTVALGDSLSSVLTAIGTATGGAVTAAYDPATDKIRLTSASEVVLGAANDTSNFLAALKLGNNGTGSVASSAALGTVKTGAALASANFGTAITAVDADGNGSFLLNGFTIDYNVNTDTLAGVVARINQSAAGVTAAYDAAADRFTLHNSSTGDVGLGLSESAGGLLGALGLAGGGTLTHGTNAEFTLNDGSTLTSLSNTLDATAHGITGLAVTVTGEETQTITVASDASAARTKIEAFLTAYNDVQSYIEAATKVTTDSKGKVTAAILSGDREIQSWGDSLRTAAFAAVPGLGGTISRLENLGIDFKSGTSELELNDAAKLDAALKATPDDVEEFFATSSTGLVDQIKGLVTTATNQNATQTKNYNRYNTSLDTQIADIERRLEQQRAIMEAAFIAMETAQSTLKNQQAALTKAFSTTSS